MKFSIGLVYYSELEDLKKSIQSLLSQSFTSFEIIIRDQSEKENFPAYRYITQKYTEEINEKKIQIFKGENIFHSGGHNFCISQMKGDNYICGSIDMIYKKDMLRNISENIKNKKNYDYFIGKLLNINERIDSCGIDKTFYWKFFDIGQNQEKNRNNRSKEVFGSSGALFCVRKKAIKAIIKKYNHFFNERLHYKNDCELMCRVQLLQQKTWYDAQVYGIHKRKVSKNSQKSKFAIFSSLRGQKKIYHLYKNSKLMKWYEYPFAWVFMKVSNIRKYFL